VRIGQDGNPQSTHFISKRSTSYVQNFNSNVQYVFPAFGKNISLDLTLNPEFIAPTLVVQHFSGNSTWLNETHENVGLSRCFYTGRINQDLNSRAVFSLCDGLVSIYHITDFFFYLYPHHPTVVSFAPSCTSVMHPPPSKPKNIYFYLTKYIRPQHHHHT
jgi:hypothetical protein